MVHKDIRIKFEIEGRRYEAVGFLNEGESSVDGDTMLYRTAGENGGAIEDDDEVFLSERRRKFPKKLQKYDLATGRRCPDSPLDVSCFGWNISGWSQYWLRLGFQRRSCDLVLRRCS